jgi:hypothetical protein
VFDGDDLRITAGVMLGAALLHPFLPGDPGFTCPLRAVTGVPCPLCGMTTSVVATVHGDLAGALVANPAGIVAVAFAFWILFARGRRITVSLPTALVVLLSMWVFELFRFSVLPS